MWLSWIANSRGEPPKLAKVKQELKHINELASKLYEALRDISDPAGQALWNVYTSGHIPGDPVYDHACHTEMQENLLRFRSITSIALDAYAQPDPNRLKGHWPEKLKPETELIRDLARLYEKITGKTAKAGHYRRSDEGIALYNGPFFDLVEDIFLTLKIEKHTQGADEEFANQNLGKAIDRALK